MSDSDQDIVAHKVRRVVGINALRKIGGIVAAEQQADVQRKRALHYMLRYGWLVLLGAAALLAYIMGLFGG